MAFTKFVLPALALAGTAFAECSVDSTTTISNPSDIATCTIFTGNIAMATDVSSGGTTDFGDLESIDGDFLYKGDMNVQTIKWDSFKNITGNFGISNLSSLSTTGLGSLTKIGGDFILEGVAQLNSLGLTKGLDEVGSVRIINTGIESLEGLANVTKIESITVANNLNLGEIGLDVSDIAAIDIGSGQQANGGQAAKFPNLESVGSITIRNCSTIDLSSLKNVSGAFRLLGNTVPSFNATKLTEAGAIVLQDNNKMKNLTFPVLEEIKSANATLWVANNTMLTKIDAFPKLETVSGDVTFKGNFTELVLGSITRIKGAFKVDTASTSFDCDKIDELGDSSAVQGAHGCRKGEDAKLGGNVNDNEDGSSDSSKDDDDSAASPLQIPAALMSSVALVATLVSMFL